MLQKKLKNVLKIILIFTEHHKWEANISFLAANIHYLEVTNAQRIVYEKILVNEGSGYSNTTGTFTCSQVFDRFLLSVSLLFPLSVIFPLTFITFRKCLNCFHSPWVLNDQKTLDNININCRQYSHSTNLWYAQYEKQSTQQLKGSNPKKYYS